jgi:hypothetical protein
MVEWNVVPNEPEIFTDGASRLRLGHLDLVSTTNQSPRPDPRQRVP